MICPACKSEMIVLEYKQIELDYCSGCRGVWFDNTELELLLHSINLDKNDVVQADLLNSARIELPNKSRRCPMCNRPMKLVDVGEQERIIIDICQRGDGLWFDGGELAQLIGQKSVKPGISADSRGMLDYLGEVFQGKS